MHAHQVDSVRVVESLVHLTYVESAIHLVRSGLGVVDVVLRSLRRRHKRRFRTKSRSEWLAHLRTINTESCGTEDASVPEEIRRIGTRAAPVRRVRPTAPLWRTWLEGRM